MIYRLHQQSMVLLSFLKEVGNDGLFMEKYIFVEYGI